MSSSQKKSIIVQFLSCTRQSNRLFIYYLIRYNSPKRLGLCGNCEATLLRLLFKRTNCRKHCCSTASSCYLFEHVRVLTPGHAFPGLHSPSQGLGTLEVSHLCPLQESSSGQVGLGFLPWLQDLFSPWLLSEALHTQFPSLSPFPRAKPRLQCKRLPPFAPSPFSLHKWLTQ